MAPLIIRKVLRVIPPFLLLQLLIQTSPKFRHLILVIFVSYTYLLDYVEADAIALKRVEEDSTSLIIPPEPYRISFKEKANLNVLIVGTSGKGKTNLLDYIVSKYFDKFSVLNFKEGDLHLGLDAAVVDVSELAPFDKEAFVDAFMLTFQPKIVGEVVSRYAGLLSPIVAKSSDWPTLVKSLEEGIREERDRINKTVLLSLRDKIQLLLPKGFGDVPLLDRVVYDLSGLNEYQKTFFAELILRKLSNTRDRALVIDEAYNVFRRTEHHTSVLERLLREGRSKNLAILVATQSLLDVPSPLIPQFDTIYVFSTSGGDLPILKSMGIGKKVISALGNFECIDVRAHKPKVLRFRKFVGVKREERDPEVEHTGEGFLVDKRYLIKLREVNGLIEVQMNDLKTSWSSGPHYVRKLSEVAETPVGDAIRGIFGRKASKILLRIEGIHIKTGIDYAGEILNLLAENGIMNTSSIARAIAEKYGTDISRTKFAVLTYLRRLLNRGQVVKTELIDAHGRKVVYYELPSDSESHLHKLMIEEIVLLARKLGFKVERRADVDLAIEGIGIEVETGKKSRKPAHREGFEEVWVVVPNEEVGKRYEDSMTLRDLYLRMKEMRGEKTTGRERKAKVSRPGSREDSGELIRASTNYVKRSMIAYLDGKKNLNWILGVIRSSGLRGELLMRVFEELESYGRRDRWERALEACRKKGML